MKKLEAVENARAIMTEGQEWGILRWLAQKPKVRKIADLATEALNNAEDSVKAAWSDDLKRAFNYLATQEEGAPKGKKNGKAAPKEIEPELLAIARGVYEADEETETMRLDAEDTFAEGERKLSIALAKEGARKALATYDLHEKAIRKAEAAGKKA
jgi:hypothetical protein